MILVGSLFISERIEFKDDRFTPRYFFNLVPIFLEMKRYLRSYNSLLI